MTEVRYRTAAVHGVDVFYREAGAEDAPAVLLLHGFPTSSHMFRGLIPVLARRYRVIAPDLPGFGFSGAPDRDAYAYTFDNLARTVEAFTDEVGLDRYAIYVFDYGAPVGFRLALARPDRITALGRARLRRFAEAVRERDRCAIRRARRRAASGATCVGLRCWPGWRSPAFRPTTPTVRLGRAVTRLYST